MKNRLHESQSYRHRMIDRIAQIDHLGIYKFFNLDTAAYKDGVLDARILDLYRRNGTDKQS